jgi:tRNA 2-thiouridine synthesizing protein A
MSMMMSEQPQLPTVQLNTRGLRCPEPVMMLHQAIRKAKSGDIVEVFATDLLHHGIFLNFVCILGMSYC